MRSVSTREFMAGVAIAQQFGRPHTPQDQARIETLFGYVKGVCRTWRRSATPASPASSRTASGPSTTPSGCTPRSATSPPDDEHEGRGEAIRQARRDGLAQARLKRIAYRQNTTPEENQ
jgi:transposase InsO family protein